MKTYIALLLCILCFAEDAFAQKIRFTDTSNKWTYLAMGGPAYGDAFSIKEWYDGDTVINGLTYQKRFSLVPKDSRLYLQLVREDIAAGKIFEFRDGVEIIYIDYNWQAGDSVYFTPKEKAYIAYTHDTINIDGHYYKEFTMYGYGAAGPYIKYIYEGLGVVSWHISGPIKLWCFYNNSRRPIVSQRLVNSQGDCSDSSLSVTDKRPLATATVSVYPQPAHDKVTIELPSTIADGRLQIINALGAVVHRQPLQNTWHVTVDNSLAPGLYYYVISDNTTGTSYKGKLLYGQ